MFCFGFSEIAAETALAATLAAAGPFKPDGRSIDIVCRRRARESKIVKRMVLLRTQKRQLIRSGTEEFVYHFWSITIVLQKGRIREVYGLWER